MVDFSGRVEHLSCVRVEVISESLRSQKGNIHNACNGNSCTLWSETRGTFG